MFWDAGIHCPARVSLVCETLGVFPGVGKCGLECVFDAHGASRDLAQEGSKRITRLLRLEKISRIIQPSLLSGATIPTKHLRSGSWHTSEFSSSRTKHIQLKLGCGRGEAGVFYKARFSSSAWSLFPQSQAGWRTQPGDVLGSCPGCQDRFALPSFLLVPLLSTELLGS